MFQTTNQPICWYTQQLYFLNPHTIDDRPDVFFSFLLGFEVVKSNWEWSRGEGSHPDFVGIYSVSCIQMEWAIHRFDNVYDFGFCAQRPLRWEGSLPTGSYQILPAPYEKWPIEIDALPIKNCDFPWRTVSHAQMVSGSIRPISVDFILIKSNQNNSRFIPLDPMNSPIWSGCLMP